MTLFNTGQRFTLDRSLGSQWESEDKDRILQMIITVHWKNEQHSLSFGLGHTCTTSSLFLFFLDLGILTLTGKALPWCFTSILFGSRGVNWISISGFGNRLVFPFSVDTSEESSTIPEWFCKHIEILRKQVLKQLWVKKL